MVADFLVGIRKERDDLLRFLESSIEYQKLKKLEEILELYGAQEPCVPRTTSVVRHSHASSSGNKKEQIEGLAAAYIMLNGRSHVAKLHEHLIQNGVDITIPTLSAYLSRAKDLFEPDRTKGWGLKTPISPIPQQESIGDSKTAEELAIPPAVNSGVEAAWPQQIFTNPTQGQT